LDAFVLLDVRRRRRLLRLRRHNDRHDDDHTRRSELRHTDSGPDGSFDSGPSSRARHGSDSSCHSVDNRSFDYRSVDDSSYASA
jgi:hypothetical protein